MAVNDLKVCEIIKEKIDHSTGASCQARISDAFDLISVDRENWFQNDVNYAAAEHYLFARWLIGYTGFIGWSTLRVANMAYTALKALLQFGGAENKLRLGRGPVAPASIKDMLWGGRGADDGLADYISTSNKPAYPDACKDN